MFTLYVFSNLEVMREVAECTHSLAGPSNSSKLFDAVEDKSKRAHSVTALCGQVIRWIRANIL